MAASSRLQATDFLHEIAIPAWFRLERPTNHARTGRCRLRLYTQEGGIADWRSSKTSKAALTAVDTRGNWAACAYPTLRTHSLLALRTRASSHSRKAKGLTCEMGAMVCSIGEPAP